MAGTTCFWSFLSLQHLEFLFVSPTRGSQQVFTNRHDITIRDLLLGRSFFDFIHPDEWAIAKQDLSSFSRRKTLAGAVTRCRLRSFVSIAKNIHPCQFENENIDQSRTWDIVDVVMYIVTECIVLAFFHTQDNCQEHSICGEPYFTPEDVDNLLNVLKKHQPTGANMNSPSIDNDCSTCNNSNRVLQMYDQSTKRRVVSWPPSNLYCNPDDGHSLQLMPESSTPIPISTLSSHQEHFHKINKTGAAACMQHTHTQSICIHHSLQNTSSSSSSSSSTILSPSSPPLPSPYYQLESIVISYGSILFYSFQLNSASSKLSPGTRTDTMDSTKTIQPHHHTFTATSSLPFVTSDQHYIPTSLPPICTSLYHKRPHHNPSSISSCQSTKRCARCGTNNSPEWRRGPNGHKTLCNACGLRYSRLMSKQQAGYNSKIKTVSFKRF
ncbi:hypothetical protein BC941DRAFT_429398 [Chlamydoabsidia padenii]|nr:hypothetical protein BC941DRAFT_429398 [Chlamydoabsidia padenii]